MLNTEVAQGVSGGREGLAQNVAARGSAEEAQAMGQERREEGEQQDPSRGAGVDSPSARVRPMTNASCSDNRTPKKSAGATCMVS